MPRATGTAAVTTSLICRRTYMRCGVWCWSVGCRVHSRLRSLVGLAERRLAASDRRRGACARGPRTRTRAAAGRQRHRASRHANMKELRANTIRILFAFDPRRSAILLIGGDKRGRWQEFYERMTAGRRRLRRAPRRPAARRRHLDGNQHKQLQPTARKGAGARSPMGRQRRRARPRDRGRARPRAPAPVARRHPGPVAETLGISQGNVSRLEARSDVYLSTLRSYVEALGGRLEIAAVFDDERVVVAVGAQQPRETA